ncbi:MAG: hypothetical protein R2828_02995 [Saprospiraceae bacterium]
MCRDFIGGVGQAPAIAIEIVIAIEIAIEIPPAHPIPSGLTLGRKGVKSP